MALLLLASCLGPARERNRPARRQAQTVSELEDSNIHVAAGAWLTDPGSASTTYGDISTWDTSKVTDMSYLFCGSASESAQCKTAATGFNGDITKWDTSSVTSMKYMFHTASKFNQDLNSWNVVSVTNMEHAFAFASIFNQPLGAWNTRSVTNMAWMLCQAWKFNQPLETWNTTSVKNMQWMFYNTFAFNQPLGAWNTSRVMNFEFMFAGAPSHQSSFDQSLAQWDTSRAKTMTGMFAFLSSMSDCHKGSIHASWSTQSTAWKVHRVIGSVDWRTDWATLGGVGCPPAPPRAPVILQLIR